MKRAILIVLVVGLLTGAENKEDLVKRDLQRFQGKWILVREESNGNKVGEGFFGDRSLAIKGDQMKLMSGPLTTEGTIILDPAKTPKQFVFAGTFFGKEVKWVGIYRFDAGKLVICLTDFGLKPPTSFSTKNGTKKHPLYLIAFKKAMSEK